MYAIDCYQVYANVIVSVIIVITVIVIACMNHRHKSRRWS